MRNQSLVIVVVLVAIGLGGGSRLLAQQPCAKGAANVFRVERLGSDWPLDFIKKSTVLKTVPFQPASAGQEGLISVEYAVVRKSVQLPYITVDGCNELAVLSNFEFVPESVIGVEKKGRVFAYIAWGSVVSGGQRGAVGIGAKMNVIFYDLHGTGHFDTVQVAASLGLPFLPEWVR